MSARRHEDRRWAGGTRRAAAAITFACSIALTGIPHAHAVDVPIEEAPVEQVAVTTVPAKTVLVNLHLNTCFPEPALPAPPYLGPAIEGAIIYRDWLAGVIIEVQGCEPLRVPIFGEYRLPLDDPVVSSEFGHRYHPVRKRWLPHTGVDLVDRERRWRVPVLAAGTGTVIAAGDFAEYGYSVVIDHGHQVATVYTHLSSISVRVGDLVVGGERIGRLGSTGAVTGPHLHFELRLGGAAVDPLDYVAPWSRPPDGHV